MAQETLQKKWFQAPASIAQIDGPPAFSTFYSNQSLHIAVGDFVHIHPTDTKLRLYIARVEGLYQVVGGKWFANVRWYYRREDLQHQPPCQPKAQEVYHTDHLDCQSVDSIAGQCQVIFKTDSLKLVTNERSIANVKNGTYICEFAYSSQTGVFSPLSRRDECPSDSFSGGKHLGGPSTRGTAAVAKELAEDLMHLIRVRVADHGQLKLSYSENPVLQSIRTLNLHNVLLDVEASIPKEILPSSWVNFRQAWLYKTTNAKTIKEVAHALLDLEDGVRILNDRRTILQTPKDHTAWRKTVSGIHTYDLLAKYVKLFKLDAQHIIMTSVTSQPTRGFHFDHGLEKRKYLPDNKPKKLQKIDDIIHSSFRHDPSVESGQPETRPVTVEVLPLKSNCPEIVAKNIYNINPEFLPPDAPASLKFIRAVLVAEKTRINVTVTFPSMTSLQSYFGRTPDMMATDHVTRISKLSLVQSDQKKKETAMGTKPELDSHFNMTPKFAERVLMRPVTCTEYLHQGHLWSFWVIEDLEEVQCKRSSDDKSTTTDHELDDDANGELGAAQALTQLIPGNTMIVSTEGNRAANERSSEHGSEEPLRSQIKWGMRSLRRASFGNRSGNGTSPNSCDTSSKDPSKDRERNLTRKIIDFSDQQHQNSEQTRITHDFMPAGRSSRKHSRREEKSIDFGAVKCPGTSGKLDNSKHSRTSNVILKLPKDMKGRWASERYKSAQLKLIDIMHERGAAPGKPILRPALREEARKDIGDTGLLDHLLKHMTDTVVTNGERFRRRHNAEGAMEYWLEDASLMEIRKAAGIEDPSWIPPPGWKPGDPLPGRGELYGYGCFNRGMTPAELAEMKKLKETVEKVRSDLHSLSSRLKRPTSRTVAPEREEGFQQDEHETTPEIKKVIRRNIESKEDMRHEPERNKLKEMSIHGDLSQTDQGDQNATQQQKSIYDSQEGESTCKSFTEAKSQLETDLTEVLKSVVLMQEDVDCTMKELGFSQGEDTIERTTIVVHTGVAIESSRPIISACQLTASDATSVPVDSSRIDPGDPRNCFAMTSSPADTSLRISMEENDTGKRKEPDFAISVGNEPNQIGLPHCGSGFNGSIQNGVQVWKRPSSNDRFVRPAMMIPQTKAFSVWAAEDVLSPGTPLSHSANASACLGHNPETSREDASPRANYRITGSGDTNQLRPRFQHDHINFLLPSTDSEGDQKSQIAVFPDHRRLDENRVQWMNAAEGLRHFQATGSHQATYQSEAHALGGVHREASRARDGLTILSFVADCEASDKASQEHVKASDTQGVFQNSIQNPISAIANVNPAVGTSPGHSLLVNCLYPEAVKRKMLHQVETNQLSISSIPSSGRTSGDAPHGAISVRVAAQCDRSESFKRNLLAANLPFNKSLANSTTDARSRAEQFMLTTAASNATSTVHQPRDPSTNLSLTSHMAPGPSNTGSPCTSSKSLSRSGAEPSSILMLSSVIAAQAGGNNDHLFHSQNSSSADQLEGLQHASGKGREQRQALSGKDFLLKGTHSTKQRSFPEIVIEKCSTQSSTNKAKSSTWLGLGPPSSSNLHS